ncbi:MAG: DUF7594 domain-containing protein [Blastocatellia bacterium]
MKTTSGIRILFGSLALLFVILSGSLASLFVNATSTLAVTLNPTADSYVRSGTSNQNTNFGTTTSMGSKDGPASPGDEDREIYLKFDMSSVASIGSGSKLRLYKISTTPSGGVTNQVRNSTVTNWIESGTGSITWANRPALTGTVHATGVWNPAANQWFEWDITAFLQAEKAAGRNVVTLVVRTTQETTQTSVPHNCQSREASHKPELVIAGGGGGTPEVNVQGGSPLVDIPDGDPSLATIANGRDFGNVDIVSGSLTQVYTIQNTGTANLTVSAFTANPSTDFGIASFPTAPIPPNQSATFSVAFNPVLPAGQKTASISFTNNDTAAPSESPYNFTVTGNATTAPVRGANIPWTYYEAEAGTLGGPTPTVVNGTLWGQVAFEARGRKAVELNAVGEFVQWTATAAANRVTVRYNVAAGVTSGTLELYVDKNDGAGFLKRADLPLSDFRIYQTISKHPFTIHLFDDVMVATTPNILAGHIVKLQYAGTAVTIDFLELELAPAANSKPDSTWLDITDSQGGTLAVAVSDDNGNDRQAFIDHIAAAAASGNKKVWIPAGIFQVDSNGGITQGYGIDVPAGVQIRGAGMWHSVIRKTYNGQINDSGSSVARVFTPIGAACVFQDFKVYDTVSVDLAPPGSAIRDDIRSTPDMSNSSTDITIQGVWTEYCGLLRSDNENGGRIIGNRARNNYKDVIHLEKSCSNWLIEDNTFRNAGDDSIAIIRGPEPIMADITILNNTVELGNAGRGIAVGGDRAIVENNVVNDCSGSGIWVFIYDHNGAKPGGLTHSCIDFKIRNNTIRNCGNETSPTGVPGADGALSILADENKPFWGLVENNDVIDSMFTAVEIGGFVGEGTGETGMGNHPLYFRNNNIENSPPASGHVTQFEDLRSPNNAILVPNNYTPYTLMSEHIYKPRGSTMKAAAAKKAKVAKKGRFLPFLPPFASFCSPSFLSSNPSIWP